MLPIETRPTDNSGKAATIVVIVLALLLISSIPYMLNQLKDTADSFDRRFSELENEYEELDSDLNTYQQGYSMEDYETRLVELENILLAQGDDNETADQLPGEEVIDPSFTFDTEWDSWDEHPYLASSYIIVGNSLNQPSPVALTGDVLLLNSGQTIVEDNSHVHLASTLPQALTYLGNTISLSELDNSGDLSFSWTDEHIADTLSIGTHGSVAWDALTDFPAACNTGYAIQAIGDELTCIDVSGVGSSNLWFDNGDLTYLVSTTDDLAIGGTDNSALFIFDIGTSLFKTPTIQIGSSTDYVSVSSTGHIELSGEATVFEDLRVPISSTKAGGSKIPGFEKFKDNGSGSQGVFTYHFDPAQEEELYFTVQMPHNWKEGSNISPHLHWTPVDGNSGNVVWGLEYTWQNIDGTYGNTTISTVTDAADGVAYKHQMPTFSSIDGTGKTYSSMLLCRIYRDADDGTDTYTSDAALLEIDFHYEINRLGTDSYP